MGRKKIIEELKKRDLSVTISFETVLRLEKFGIKNKSKLINQLLIEYFKITKNN